MSIYWILALQLVLGAYFLGWRPLWLKITWLKWLVRKKVRRRAREEFWVTWYGAYSIDPKNLVYWICLKTDHEKNRLNSDSELQARLRNLLNSVNYPKSARDHVLIGFESQETVDRESGGNCYVHWK